MLWCHQTHRRLQLFDGSIINHLGYLTQFTLHCLDWKNLTLGIKDWHAEALILVDHSDVFGSSRPLRCKFVARQGGYPACTEHIFALMHAKRAWTGHFRFKFLAVVLIQSYQKMDSCSVLFLLTDWSSPSTAQHWQLCGRLDVAGMG